MDSPKKSTQERTIWTVEEMRTALDSMEDPILHLAVHLTLVGALREGEVAEIAVRDRTRTNLREPRRYKVIIYNDDFTTMEFVVLVLTSVFFKSAEEAEALMLAVHKSGSAVVGIYSYDMAISKVRKATMMAREENFPLRLECKPE